TAPTSLLTLLQTCGGGLRLGRVKIMNSRSGTAACIGRAGLLYPTSTGGPHACYRYRRRGKLSDGGSSLSTLVGTASSASAFEGEDSSAALDVTNFSPFSSPRRPLAAPAPSLPLPAGGYVLAMTRPSIAHVSRSCRVGWKMPNAPATGLSSLKLGLDSTLQVYAYTNRGVLTPGGSNGDLAGPTQGRAVWFGLPGQLGPLPCAGALPLVGLTVGLRDRTASQITVNYGYRALPRDLPRVPKPLADMTRPLWQPLSTIPTAGGSQDTGVAQSSEQSRRSEMEERGVLARMTATRETGRDRRTETVRAPAGAGRPTGTPTGPVPLPPRRLNNDGTNPDVLEPIAIMEDVSSSHRKHGTAIAHKRENGLKDDDEGDDEDEDDGDSSGEEDNG
ncbi:hypothetical protein THAOC_25866, partial [Thalassiosira oceanica]